MVVLAVNAFWWLPGIWLASTKGPSGFAFAHPEGVILRPRPDLQHEAPIESLLSRPGLPGHDHAPAARSDSWLGVHRLLCGRVRLGLRRRPLPFTRFPAARPPHLCVLPRRLPLLLEPCFKSCSRDLRSGPHALDRWVIVGAILIGVRVIGFPGGYSMFAFLRGWFTASFLSSRPTPRAQWIVDRVARHLKPGERLLYEEGGFGVEIKDERGVVIQRLPDAFQGGRLSGILPERTGVELIGGPYLHASLQTNFTQFGEGKLCGKADWTKDDFIRYAKLYGPSAILCWTPHARRFCTDNPDLVQDPGTRIQESRCFWVESQSGFEGDFLEGSGRVEAEAGVLRLHDLTPGLDGSVVLRYHSVPYLRARPAVAIEQEYREDDPVPFIRLRPPPGTSDVELKLHLPVGR